MVLVTLGTQNQTFYRLLDQIENSSLQDEIIVQAGGSVGYKSKKMKLFSFINYEEMQEYIKKADLIITHGGTGSVLFPLECGKKVIACARLKKYKEHINDHQCELVSVFGQEGYILELHDGEALDDVLKKVEKFEPKKYVSNTEHFIECLQKEIES